MIRIHEDQNEAGNEPVDRMGRFDDLFRSLLIAKSIDELNLDAEVLIELLKEALAEREIQNAAFFKQEMPTEELLQLWINKLRDKNDLFPDLVRRILFQSETFLGPQADVVRSMVMSYLFRVVDLVSKSLELENDGKNDQFGKMIVFGAFALGAIITRSYSEEDLAIEKLPGELTKLLWPDQAV